MRKKQFSLKDKRGSHYWNVFRAGENWYIDDLTCHRSGSTFVGTNPSRVNATLVDQFGPQVAAFLESAKAGEVLVLGVPEINGLKTIKRFS